MFSKDPLWMSVIWGRIGAALLLLLSFILQQAGLELSPDEQASIVKKVGMFLKDFGILIGAILALFSKWRESDTAPISIKKAVWVLIALVPLATSVVFTTGCAPQQSVTKQIMAQTSDPATIALAVYTDALKVYVEAQEIYKPYAKYAKAKHPDLSEKIIGNFKKAWGILQDWKVLGTVPGGDNLDFRGYLREILIDIAIIEDGG